MLQSLVGTLLQSTQRWSSSMVLLYCREISATYCTCCFSLVNNPVLSSFLYGAFRARTVYGYHEWIHRNTFLRILLWEGDAFLLRSGLFLYWDAMSHSFFRIFKCDFLTLSDFEILSVNFLLVSYQRNLLMDLYQRQFFSFSFLFGKQVLQCLPLAS